MSGVPSVGTRRDGSTFESYGPGHGPAKGAGTHPDGCRCNRCNPKGNLAAVVHGARSPVIVSERAELIAQELRHDFANGADEVSLRLLSESLAQVQLASEALHRLTALGDDPKHQAAARVKLLRLSDDLRSWMRESLRLLDRLAATPQARAEVAARLASVARRADDGDDFDIDALTIAERKQFYELLDKGKRT